MVKVLTELWRFDGAFLELQEEGQGVLQSKKRERIDSGETGKRRERGLAVEGREKVERERGKICVCENEEYVS